MILLRTLAIWVGCGVANMLTFAFAEEEPAPPATRTDRTVTPQFAEPKLESTPLSLQGPEL
jgi:hypothetical protein